MFAPENKVASIYKKLVRVVRGLGYRYQEIPGISGYHKGFIGQRKTIQIGKDQSCPEKVVSLAHELGHALDIRHNPPGLSELLFLLNDWEEYEGSLSCYNREVKAWAYGEEILSKTGWLAPVKEEFYALKELSLLMYQQARANGNIRRNQG